MILNDVECTENVNHVQRRYTILWIYLLSFRFNSSRVRVFVKTFVRRTPERIVDYIDKISVRQTTTTFRVRARATNIYHIISNNLCHNKKKYLYEIIIRLRDVSPFRGRETAGGGGLTVWIQ